MSTHENSLGLCCICGGTHRVRNLVMLDRKSPMPGRGWGCVLCGLEADGAVAVLCDACLGRYNRQPEALKWACRGYPNHDGRVAFETLQGSHRHNEAIPH